MKVFDSFFAQSWPRHAIFASLFWGAVAGLVMVWPFLITVIPLWAFVVGGIVISAALATAKYLKRPGTE